MLPIVPEMALRPDALLILVQPKLEPVQVSSSEVLGFGKIRESLLIFGSP
jgi:hypothetical protein